MKANMLLLGAWVVLACVVPAQAAVITFTDTCPDLVG